MKRAVLALLALVAACDAGAPSSTTSSTASSTSTASETTQAAANLTIGPSSAAGINDQVGVTVEALTAAAPGFYVAERQTREEGTLVKVIMLSTDAGDMFKVFAGRNGLVREIAAISGQVKGPTDEKIGLSTFYQAPHDQVTYCEARRIGNAAGFACASDQNGHFWRLYRLPASYDGPSDPYDAIDPDAATDATLAELRWRAS